ncbi:MAG: recombination regulator RecX [Pseudoxanthomonas sp.]|nr:recombination regulator RecX [Pseudoxanthomonas sp.]
MSRHPAHAESVDGLQPRRRKTQELTPVQRALALLVRREHSRKELTRKLALRGIAGEDATAAIERLAGDGWQSDARFGEMLVRTRASQGYGPLRIRAELGTHGLDADTVSAVLEGFGGDWAQVARDLLRRRFRNSAATDPAVQRKAIDFLYRRGFQGDHVRLAVHGQLRD